MESPSKRDDGAEAAAEGGAEAEGGAGAGGGAEFSISGGAGLVNC